MSFRKSDINVGWLSDKEWNARLDESFYLVGLSRRKPASLVAKEIEVEREFAKNHKATSALVEQIRKAKEKEYRAEVKRITEVKHIAKEMQETKASEHQATQVPQIKAREVLETEVKNQKEKPTVLNRDRRHSYSGPSFSSILLAKIKAEADAKKNAKPKKSLKTDFTLYDDVVNVPQSPSNISSPSSIGDLSSPSQSESSAGESIPSPVDAENHDVLSIFSKSPVGHGF